MTDKNKQQLIDDMLNEVERRENEFPIYDDCGVMKFPILKNGVVKGWDAEDPRHNDYRGLALEVNDHGNVTVWRRFKNGNRREIASRV